MPGQQTGVAYSARSLAQLPVGSSLSVMGTTKEINTGFGMVGGSGWFSLRDQGDGTVKATKIAEPRKKVAPPR